MVEAGILHEDGNVELIQGEVIEKHPPGKKRFTVEEYHRMAEVGILHEDDRVELIEGEILEINPIGSRHAACVNRLNALIVRRVAESYRKRPESGTSPRWDRARTRRDGPSASGGFLRRGPPRTPRCVTPDRGFRYYAPIRPRSQAASLCQRGYTGSLDS